MTFSIYEYWPLGILFALVASGVVSVLMWVVARVKQRRMEALLEEMERNPEP